MSNRTQVVEQTAKRWKLVQLIGVLMTAAGVASLIMANQQTPADSGGIGLGVLGIVFGIVALIVGKLCAWWFHG